ncbi:MAG: hypothetical protein V4577_19855 [Bacteroidota bacterium]
MRIKGLQLLLLIWCLSVGCFHASKQTSNTDDFYSKKGGWDPARIPFLKPYEAVKVGAPKSWFMNLDGVDGDTGFQNIKRAAVADSIIFVYSTNSVFQGIDTRETWHVIVPGKHIEKGFSSYRDYIGFLNKLGIQKEPHLYNIDSIADYFENHETIDWNAIAASN